MKVFKQLFAICCLLILSTIFSKQELNAASGLVPVDFIQFSYYLGDEPPAILPFSGNSFLIPAYGVVYDDRAVEITFYCSNGAADAEICDGDFVVGTWHKPSGTQTMTIRLPILPRVYTIYLYLQNGVTLQGEYTVE